MTEGEVVSTVNYWTMVLTFLFGVAATGFGSWLNSWLGSRNESDKQRRQWLKEYRDGNIRPVQEFLDWAVRQDARFVSGSRVKYPTWLEKAGKHDLAVAIRDSESKARDRAFSELVDRMGEQVEPALISLGDDELGRNVHIVQFVLELKLSNVTESPEAAGDLAEALSELPDFKAALNQSYQRIKQLLTEHV